MSRSGARQWWHECSCLPGVAAERDTQPWTRMHSQVSKRNAEYFVAESRIHPSYRCDVAELRRFVDQTDGSIIVCNSCGELKEVSDDALAHEIDGLDPSEKSTRDGPAPGDKRVYRCRCGRRKAVTGRDEELKATIRTHCEGEFCGGLSTHRKQGVSR